ncbi:MAG TPA: hypothetical protein VL093_04935 [Flavipsychrobacter sp.]|nr:hypothetical protein [Flavipsychrobacter sp.]
MIKKIFVLESSWDSENPLEHHSVMPIITELTKQRNIKAYHQVFTDAKSFAHWVAKINDASTSGSLLYIAAHGNRGSLSGVNGSIQRQTIVRHITRAKNIDFIHFGCCLFGNVSNLELIMKKAKHLTWVAGYEKEVDWVDSSLFDIFLWSRISHVARSSMDRKLKTSTIVQNVIEKQVNGMVKELGFNFACRYGKNIYLVSPYE